jgi:hypothetical protein
MSREPPRGWLPAATSAHRGVPPPAQRVIIRTVAAKEVHTPSFADHGDVPQAIISDWFRNECRYGQ